jgi:Domain of unknown function (DUF4926)
MTQELKEYDVVVLLETTPATHFVTGEPIILPRGCTGTVVDELQSDYALVEFADQQGRAFAIEAIPATRLMVLVHEPLIATA